MDDTKESSNSNRDRQEERDISATDFLTAGVFSGLTIGGGVILGYEVGNVTNTGLVSVIIGLLLGLLIVVLWLYKKIKGYIK